MRILPIIYYQNHISVERLVIRRLLLKECAVVTHYRVKNAEDGSGIIVDPDA